MTDRALILSGGGARGAFQAGVLRYLEEIHWKPDLVCGSSVGAVNAVAMGCGMAVVQIIHLWSILNRRKIYRLDPDNFLSSLFGRRKFYSLFDTCPLKETLSRHVDFTALKASPIRVLITATDMKRGVVEWFDNETITLDHIMASCAIPLLFPWQNLGDEIFWDGGVMANNPVAPALDSNVKSIIVVLLSPVGAFNQSFPRTLHEASELVFEHLLLGSYQSLTQKFYQGALSEHNPRNPTRDVPKITIVAPNRRLGFRSMINFSGDQAKRLIHEGYQCARQQLSRIFS